MHRTPLGAEGRRISAGVDGVRWRPRSSKPLWGCVAVPGGFDPHALPPPAFAGLCRSWAGQVMRRGFAALQLWCATHRPGGGGRSLQESAWPRDVASGGGPAASRRGRSTGRRRPLVAGVGLAARRGVWRWSRRVTARTVDRAAAAARCRSRPGRAMWRLAVVPQRHGADDRPGGGGRSLQESAWPRDVASGGGPAASRRGRSTGRRRPLVAGVGLAARCGVRRWSRARMCALPTGTRRAGAPSVRYRERLSTRTLGPPADAS